MRLPLMVEPGLLPLEDAGKSLFSVPPSVAVGVARVELDDALVRTKFGEVGERF